MELFRALGALTEPPGPHLARLCHVLAIDPPPTPADFADFFTLQLYPYASVYLGAEGMLGGEARDRIAGFWRAIGEDPPKEPDHLAVMLAFFATLGDFEQQAGDRSKQEALRRARKAFLWEHLLSWLPAYLAKASQIAPPAYQRWGQILWQALAEQAQSLGRPSTLPLHLREAPVLQRAQHEGEDLFFTALLAPVQSGLILVRSDLERAARTLDLGLRVAERQFALKALVSQDATATLHWLIEEASAWEAIHKRHEDLLGDIARFWAARAHATALLLQEMTGST